MTSIPSDAERRTTLTAALRQLADAIDTNPGMELPYAGALSIINFSGQGDSAEVLSKTFGRPDRVDVNRAGRLNLEWNLGGLKVTTHGPQCKEKVTAVRIVDGREVPVVEYAIPDQFKTASAKKAEVQA